MAFPDPLESMQTVYEFHSKLVGSECRLFGDRIEVEAISRNSLNTGSSEMLSYADVGSVHVTRWPGLSVANLVIRGRNGKLIELRMLGSDEAERAKRAIEDLVERDRRRQHQRHPAA